MITLDETNRKIDHILFIGDTHGENKNIPHHVERQTCIAQQEKKALIHVGDFGVGFRSYETEMDLLDTLNTKLIEHNTIMYVVRGNHDNPEWFNGEFVFSNIVFLKDHTVLEFQRMGKDKRTKIYCNGGSISIDRSNRTDGVSYWKGEGFKELTPEQLLEIPTDLDCIVTHNRPLGLHPTVYNSSVLRWCMRDDQLDHDLKEEQLSLKKMFDSIRERNNSRNNIVHYFGHYHWSHKERIGDIAHITLGMHEVAEFREY
jgi:predicted phosphodiesterase